MDYVLGDDARYFDEDDYINKSEELEKVEREIADLETRRETLQEDVDTLRIIKEEEEERWEEATIPRPPY